MFSYSNGTIWFTYRSRGRSFTVSTPSITPTPTGGKLRSMGKRPPLRALRARQPQVQACKLPRRAVC